jgi:hypothetical protein
MSTIKTNTLSNVAGTQSIGVDRVAQGTAAAWVNFNGTGTVAIGAQYNVSSITDEGVGDYTVNFTNSMVDNNYSANGLSLGTGGDAGHTYFIVSTSSSAIRVRARRQGGTDQDPTVCCVTIFR